MLDEDEVAERAARLAGAWRERGLVAGDRVAVRAGNGLDFVAARDAATALGLVFVPVNPKLAPPEVEHLVSVSGARLLFEEGAPAEGAPVPLRAGAGATILFTSGTTGLPKGCLRPEEAEAARLAEMTRTYGLSPADTHLVVCPLAHSAPGAIFRAARRAGARTILSRRFDAAAFLDAARRATVVFLVPTLVERILAHGGRAPASLRAVIVAGAPFAEAARARFAAWLGPGRLWEFYGASETGTITVRGPDAPPGPAGHVGHPPPGVEVRVADDGEIQVRSAACMAGYVGEPPLPPGAFVAPGDVGRFADDGGLVLIDRKGDLIITGGVNVYPAEVERALLAHPAVRGAVVFGRPHADWGEEVCALVAGDATEAELRAFLRGRVAGFKIPKVIRLVAVEELPIGPSGKPLRRVARGML
jgi:long-chain acyl-CoA synthetase